MHEGVGLLILDVMPIYMIIALDIVIIICSSINCPTVICLPRMLFSREKPLVKYMVGLTTPLMRWVASICYLCAGVVYIVLLGSPTGLITLVS